MKNLYIHIIEKIMSETGYDYEYVDKQFGEALSQGVKPIDIIDAFLDGNI